MPAASSILGQCPACCDCPAPVLQWESRTKTKAKDGYPNSLYVDIRDPGNFWDGKKYRQALSPCGNLVDYPAGILDWSCEAGFPCFGVAPGVTLRYIFQSASTFRCCNLNNWPAPGSCGSEHGLWTLTDEHTTAILESETLAELAAIAWDNDWDDTPGSSRNLSPDESALSVRDSRYRWLVPPHRVGSGKRYVVSWVERFTPEGGGEPVDEVRCAAWNGVLPEGYDPADQETWPVLGPFDYAVPTTDGERSVGYYAIPGDPGSFVANSGLGACRGACPEEEAP